MEVYREVEFSGREDWLEKRTQSLTLGSSDLPIILGLTTWSSRVRLYAEKLGQMPGIQDNAKLQMGRRMEPVILEMALEALEGAGQDVQGGGLDGRFLVSTVHPWASATLDAWVQLGEDRYTVEVKNTDRWESWAEGPPDAYVCQCQHQMLVTGAPRMLLVVLIRGWDLKWCWIERAQEYLEQVHIPNGVEFHRQLVERELPPVDPSDETRAALAKLYPNSVPGVEIALGGEWIDLDLELVQAEEIAAAAQARADEIKNRLRALMAEAEAARIPNGVLWTYKGKNGRRQLRRYDAQS